MPGRHGTMIQTGRVFPFPMTGLSPCPFPESSPAGPGIWQEELDGTVSVSRPGSPGKADACIWPSTASTRTAVSGATAITWETGPTDIFPLLMTLRNSSALTGRMSSVSAQTTGILWIPAGSPVPASPEKYSSLCRNPYM